MAAKRREDLVLGRRGEEEARLAEALDGPLRAVLRRKGPVWP